MKNILIALALIFAATATNAQELKQIQSFHGNDIGSASTSAIGDINVSVTGTAGANGADTRSIQPNITTYNSNYEHKRNPVAPAYAAPLVTSNDTCMGSTATGGSGITLGFSFATTWKDKDCVIRKDSRYLHNSGHSTVAFAMMCDKPNVRKAVERAGTPAEKAACGIE